MVVTVGGDGQDRRLVKTEGWSRQKVGQDRRLVKTEGWSRQKVGQDRRLTWSSRKVVKTRRLVQMQRPRVDKNKLLSPWMVPPSHQGSKIVSRNQLAGMVL
jgi:hypothetical protein